MPKNKQEYRAFVKQRKDIPIFFQPWWLDTLCGEEHWDVLLAKDGRGQIRGVWPFPKQNFFGFHVSRHIPLTPFLGIKILVPENLSNKTRQRSFEKRIIKQLIQQHKKLPFIYYNQFFCQEFANWLPLFWHGYKQETYYRYALFLEKGLEHIHSGLAAKVKYDIQKFESIGIIVESQDAHLVYTFTKESMEHSGKRMPIPVDKFKTLVNKMSKNTKIKILIAKLKDSNQCIGGCLIAIDQDTSYLLVNGLNSRFRNTGASSALIWQGIQYSARHTKYFDFAGSMIKSIASFFSGFGGEMQPYHRIYRSSNRIVNYWLKVRS